MNRLSPLLVLVVSFLFGVAEIAGAHEPAAAAPATTETPGLMRGMVVSCPTWGPIWGSPAMADSLAELDGLGVEWIAIHPYASVRRDGTIRFRPTAETEFLTRAVELVREAGMELFWKPHLAYWGSFAWRGEIRFGDDARAWKRFFDGYRRFIVDQAAFAEAAGVRLFAVGVELEATMDHEAEWREILAAVREVYSGRITYAANWDRLDAVPFWDDLDLIGVHAYFPLAVSEDPDPTSLRTAWDRHLTDLRALAADHGDKPVLFAEIGYNRSAAAAREPWDNRVENTAQTRELRRRLIEVALERAEEEPLVTGIFWWKWIPGPTGHDRDFSMKDPEARAALAARWATTPAPPRPAATVTTGR